MANFMIIEMDNSFAILPSREGEVVFFQTPEGGWVCQPLPEEGWEARAWWWGEDPLELILSRGCWQPLEEGSERRIPTQAARLGWAWVLSSRGTR